MVYIIGESLCCTPESSEILYDNYISIKNKQNLKETKQGWM